MNRSRDNWILNDTQKDRKENAESKLKEIKENRDQYEKKLVKVRDKPATYKEVLVKKQL